MYLTDLRNLIASYNFSYFGCQLISKSVCPIAISLVSIWNKRRMCLLVATSQILLLCNRIESQTQCTSKKSQAPKIY